MSFNAPTSSRRRKRARSRRSRSSSPVNRSSPVTGRRSSTKRGAVARRKPALERRKRPPTAARECRVETVELVVAEREIAGSGVLARVLDVPGLRDREHARRADEERERHLPRGGAVRRRDLREHATARRARGGKLPRAERAVADDRDVARAAPRQDGVLDRALLEV